MSAQSIVITLALWLLFGFQHSFFAQAWWKQRVAKVFGQPFIDYGYRFCYFAVQCVVYPTFWYIVSHLESGPVLFAIPEALWPLEHVFRVIGHFCLLLSVLAADVNTFVGTKPLFAYLRARLRGLPPPPVAVFGHNNLVISFPFDVVRHPMYLGIFLSLVTSTSVFTEKVVLNVLCLMVYLKIGTHFEELQLIRIFGPAYEEYRKRVPKYVPSPALLWRGRTPVGGETSY